MAPQASTAAGAAPKVPAQPREGVPIKMPGASIQSNQDRNLGAAAGASNAAAKVSRKQVESVALDVALKTNQLPESLVNKFSSEIMLRIIQGGLSLYEQKVGISDSEALVREMRLSNNPIKIARADVVEKQAKAQRELYDFDVRAAGRRINAVPAVFGDVLKASDLNLGGLMSGSNSPAAPPRIPPGESSEDSVSTRQDQSAPGVRFYLSLPPRR